MSKKTTTDVKKVSIWRQKKR